MISEDTLIIWDFSSIGFNSIGYISIMDRTDCIEKLNITRSRFLYAPKKVIVRGLGIVKPQKQLDNLIEWLGIINQG